MPTGYTVDVIDGKITDLRSFALQCARGMGALIMMRDDPWDAPIPEEGFKPSLYNADRLKEAEAERQRLYNMTDAEADDAAKVEFAEKQAAKQEWLVKRREQRARYQAMIALVEPWERSPEGLKDFMLEQLRTGMEFDCPEGDRYYDEPVEQSGTEWRKAKLERVHKDIMYHAKGDAEERARTDVRNAWIAQLRASLADLPATPEPKREGE